MIVVIDSVNNMDIDHNQNFDCFDNQNLGEDLHNTHKSMSPSYGVGVG